MKFSVIIPVYNGEKHLKGAVDSLQRGTYTDWEAIVVDDGSTDETLKLAQTLAEKDGRIKPVHKENGGVSAARNMGMKFANGEWIIWLDSDDAYVENALETIAKIINANDGINCIQFPYNIINASGKIQPIITKAYREFGGGVYSGKEAFDILFAREGYGGLNWQPWRFAFRHDKLPTFRTGVIHEDVDVLPAFTYGLDKVYIAKEALYAYRPANEGAATAAFNAKRVKDIIDVTEHVYASIAKLHMDREVERRFKSTLACNLFGFYLASPGFPEPGRSESLELFAKHRDMLIAIDDPPKTAWVKRFMIRVLGVKGAAKLIWRLAAKRTAHALDWKDAK